MKSPKPFTRLIQPRKIKVGVVVPCKRTIPVTSNVKVADADGTLLNVPADEIPAEPFQCYAVPTGCMLIDVQALKRIPQPWFDVEMDKDGSLLTGEDVFFCREAGKAGFEVWCDPTIQVGHIGTFVY